MTVLAERTRDDTTRLLGESTATIIGDDFKVEDVGPTGGTDYFVLKHFDWADELGAWGDHERRFIVVVPRSRGYATRLESPDFADMTCSLSAPSFETGRGTGRSISEYLLNAWDAIRTSAGTETVASVLDIPTALQHARTQAGLPVNDLAAVFGIKRRQFYNLISGEVASDLGRERRIGRVTEGIGKLSELAGGNSRSVRAALLARLEGDSVYDAAVADDEDRFATAMQRAVDALGSGLRRDRLAPSQRATSSEAAEVREFLRATRDDTNPRTDP
jgi:hypothetical protein